MFILVHRRVEVEFLMSISIDLAYGVYSTPLNSNLDVSIYSVGVPTFTGQLIKFTPTVRRVRYGSSFFGQ